MLKQRELAEALKAAEESHATPDGLRDGLEQYKLAARHWALHVKAPNLLFRLAAICDKHGLRDAAEEMLHDTVDLFPEDIVPVLRLTRLLLSHGDDRRAYQALLPRASITNPDPRVVLLMVEVCRRTERFEDGLAYAKCAYDADPSNMPAAMLVVRCLSDLHQTSDLCVLIKELLTKPDLTAPQVFACYSALLRCSREADLLGDLTTRLMAIADAGGETAKWSARIARAEGRIEDAINDFKRAVKSHPEDVALLIDASSTILLAGHVGRDAEVLSIARKAPGKPADLNLSLEAVDKLLTACGGSLEVAAEDPGAFAHVKSPETVFSHLIDEAMVRPLSQRRDRKGLVMIAHSLAGGGAERILATCINELRADPRLAWLKLYVFDLSAKDAKDFYLPLTGMTRDEIIVLDRPCVVSESYAALPKPLGVRAQKVLDQLRKDRPAVVHSWLDGTNIPAGIAAIHAEVPQIILHTHNMRPMGLLSTDPSLPRYGACYNALLRHPSVELIGCAKACVDDYRDWADLAEEKATTLYNGIDFEAFRPVGAEARNALLERFAIPTGRQVVGVAFNFSAVKQPLLWIDAAAGLIREGRDCHFLMCGDGRLRPDALAYIEQLGLSDRFTLPGRLEDIAAVLPVMDVFVLSSSSEALPNVLIESQACGVPVVSFDVGGVAETMDAGKTGILVDEQSAHALSEGIAQVLDNDEWREEAQRIAPDFVRSRFAIEKMLGHLKTKLFGPSRRMKIPITAQLRSAYREASIRASRNRAA